MTEKLGKLLHTAYDFFNNKFVSFQIDDRARSIIIYRGITPPEKDIKDVKIFKKQNPKVNITYYATSSTMTKEERNNEYFQSIIIKFPNDRKTR